MSGEFDLLILRSAVFVAAALAFAGLSTLVLFMLKRQKDDSRDQLNRQFRDLFVAVDPDHVWLLQWGGSAGLAALFGFLSGSVVAAGLAAMLAAALPRLAIAQMRRHRLNRFRSQIPDLLMLISGSLRSGSGLSVALARSAASSPVPARQHLERLLGELRLGTPLADALTALERRVRAEEVTLFATALRFGAETGGPLAQTLESLSDAIRRRLALEARIRALTAQGRLQAWIMALLPALVLALLALVDPPSFNEIAFTNGGRAVLVAVLVAQFIGFRLVRRIVSIEV